jgi:hypothetical protein
LHATKPEIHRKIHREEATVQPIDVDRATER